MIKRFALAFMGAIFILSVYSINQSHATFFSDSFDNPTYTNANWTVASPTWDFVTLSGSDIGYRGTISVGYPGAVSFANNSQYYYQNDLVVETYVRLETPVDASDIDTAAGLVFISGSLADLDYREYSVLLSIDDDSGAPVGGLSVYNYSSDGSVDEVRGATWANIIFDTFYRLRMERDSQGDIDVYLYDNSTLLASLTGIDLLASFDSGMVGLGTDRSATFNDFSIAANPVPEPTSIFLLGSGLIGLVGIGRKKFFKK